MVVEEAVSEMIVTVVPSVKEEGINDYLTSFLDDGVGKFRGWLKLRLSKRQETSWAPRIVVNTAKRTVFKVLTE